MSDNRQNSEISSARVPTLKKRSDFLRLRSGKRHSTKSLILQSATIDGSVCSSSQQTHVGYTVTKKVGNSVVRSRIRRRLRAAVSQVFPKKAQSSCDYVVIGKHGALTQSFTSILKDMELALDHIHKKRPKGIRKSINLDSKQSSAAQNNKEQ